MPNQTTQVWFWLKPIIIMKRWTIYLLSKVENMHGLFFPSPNVHHLNWFRSLTIWHYKSEWFSPLVTSTNTLNKLIWQRNWIENPPLDNAIPYWQQLPTFWCLSFLIQTIWSNVFGNKIFHGLNRPVWFCLHYGLMDWCGWTIRFLRTSVVEQEDSCIFSGSYLRERRWEQFCT